MPGEAYFETPEFSVIKISGTLAYDEFASVQATPEDEDTFRGQNLDLLILLEDLEGWRQSGEWGTLRFVDRSNAVLRRIAVVGEKRWHNAMDMFLLKGLRPIEIEHFEPHEESLARVLLTQE